MVRLEYVKLFTRLLGCATDARVAYLLEGPLLILVDEAGFIGRACDVLSKYIGDAATLPLLAFYCPQQLHVTCNCSANG